MGVQVDGSMSVGVSRLEVIEGPSGRRRRTKAERARIAAESMMPGVTVAEVARKHGTTRWQIYDWRKQIRKGKSMPVRVGHINSTISLDGPLIALRDHYLAMQRVRGQDRAGGHYQDQRRR